MAGTNKAHVTATALDPLTSVGVLAAGGTVGLSGFPAESSSIANCKLMLFG
jgi:hypothetical protein